MNEIFCPSRVKLASLALTAVAGIVSAHQFAALPSVWVRLGLALLAIGLFAARWRLSGVFLLALVWAFGFAALRLDNRLPAEWEGQAMLVEGVVADIPKGFDAGQRFLLQTEAVIAPAEASVPRQIRLSWYDKNIVLKAGERWRLRVRLKRPHGFFNPGGMDYELWLFANNIGATGYVRESTDNQRLTVSSPNTLQGFRQSLYDRLNAVLAGSPMAGIVVALVMGAENGITADQWEVLRRTGTAHLVAISGSHISLIAGLVYWLVRRCCAGLALARFPPHAVAALAGVASAWGYAALANFAIPTQRAVVMIAVVMGGILAQRNIRPVPTLALALLAVSLYDTTAVLSAGFWLSFASVGLILWVVTGRLRASGWWAALWRVNWAASLGLVPLLLIFFQQVSLVSPLANGLSVPVIGMALTPLCLLGGLSLGVYPPLGVWLLRTAGDCLGWVWLALQHLSAWQWAQWQHAAPPGWSLPFAFCGVVLLLAPKGVPARWLGVVLMVPALTVVPSPPELGKFRLTMLDVGQALAVVVQTQGHTLVFDTGAKFSQQSDAGEAVVEPFLRHQGLNGMDVLVVSHGDNDHIGGAESLLRQVSAGRVISSVPDRLPIPAQACQAGEHWEWDGVSFDMLSPFGTLGNDNDNSCVLKVASWEGAALLTGDIEKAAEATLVEQYGGQLQADILIAPHHGSKTSSTAGFLAAVRPLYVLVPVGYRNQWNFPHPDVVQRYLALGSKVLDSAAAGAIVVEPGSFPPQSYRQTQGKYWNAK